MSNLQRAGENLIEAVAYGDAAGLPVETWNALEIKMQYGWLNRLMSTHSNPFFAGEHEAGTWSDDTQLTIAVADALIKADGFDIDAQAETLIKAFFETPQVSWEGKIVPRGWGGSVIKSTKRLIRGDAPSASGVSGINKEGKPLGTGNGVVMKIAPLVFWQAARATKDEQRHHEYDVLTQMTHNTLIARVCSRVHGDVLHYLLRSSQDDNEVVESFPDLIMERTLFHEREVHMPSPDVSSALNYLTRKDISQNPDAILAFTDGRGSYVPQTLAMAYGAFYHLAGDFHHTVYEAVNLGGDTDSIASIVAAMVNFVAGGDIELPPDANLLKERERLQAISRQLAYAALRHNT